VKYTSLYVEARNKGLGAIATDDGTLLDEAVLPMFENVLETARFYGIEIPDPETA